MKPTTICLLLAVLLAGCAAPNPSTAPYQATVRPMHTGVSLFRVIVPVRDLDTAVSFYGRVLETPGVAVSGGRHYFNCGGTILACFDPRADADGYDPSPLPEWVYFAVDDVHSAYDRCVAAGATPEPGDIDGTPAGVVARRPWGEVSFYARDPSGNGICFVERATVFTAGTEIATTPMRTRFGEIDVERINIVEADGTTKLVLSNQANSPGGTLDGNAVRPRGRRSPGLYFFNGEGDECGGLAFGGGDLDGDGIYTAFSGMSLDRYRCDQVLGLQYHEREGESYLSGLRVWDRPPGSLPALVDLLKRIDEADPASRTTLQEELDRRSAAGEYGRERLFIGVRDEVPNFSMYDDAGRVRIVISIGIDNIPIMQFLDEQGQVVFELPPIPPELQDR